VGRTGSIVVLCCGHNVSLVTIWVGDINGVNRKWHLHIAKRTQTPPSLLIPFKLGIKAFYYLQASGLCSLVIAFCNIS